MKPSHRKKTTASKKVSAEHGFLTVSLPELLVDGTDVQFRTFVADLFAAVAGMHALRRALADAADLTAAEFSVLLATWNLRNSGAVSVAKVAAHLHVAAAHVTTEAGRLVNSGLLTKLPDPDDFRSVNLALSRQGEKVLSDLAPLLRRINDRLFAGNSPDTLRAISRFLRHVAEESVTSRHMAKTFRKGQRTQGT